MFREFEKTDYWFWTLAYADGVNEAVDGTDLI
jgi:hypothetical protein